MDESVLSYIVLLGDESINISILYTYIYVGMHSLTKIKKQCFEEYICNNVCKKFIYTCKNRRIVRNQRVESFKVNDLIFL